jgi:hypothetical protein
MKRTLGSLVMLACVASAGLIVGARAHGQTARGTLDEMFRVWQERQDRAHSFSFEWEQQVHETASPFLPGASGPAAGTEQDSARPFTQRGEVQVDGDRFNYRNERDSDGLSNRRLFDGTSTKGLFFFRNDAPTGGVRPGAKHGEHLDVDLVPILFTYRAMQSGLSKIYPENCGLFDQKGDVDGHECFIVEQPDERISHVYAYWVDPSRDYVVVRYVIRVEGKDRGQTNVTYSEDEAQGWVPASWNFVWLNSDGSLAISKTYRVTKYSINEPIADDKFELTFPRGTRLRDERTGRIYLEGSRGAFGSPGGSRSWASYWPWLLVPAAGLCLEAAIWFLAKQRKRE